MTRLQMSNYNGAKAELRKAIERDPDGICGTLARKRPEQFGDDQEIADSTVRGPFKWIGNSSPAHRSPWGSSTAGSKCAFCACGPDVPDPLASVLPYLKTAPNRSGTPRGSLPYRAAQSRAWPHWPQRRGVHAHPLPRITPRSAILWHGGYLWAWGSRSRRRITIRAVSPLLFSPVCAVDAWTG